MGGARRGRAPRHRGDCQAARPRPSTSSLRRSSRSPGSSADGMTNRRSPRSCSSARARSTTTCERCSASSAWRLAPSWCAWKYPAGIRLTRRAARMGEVPVAEQPAITTGDFTDAFRRPRVDPDRRVHATSPVEGRANQTQGARNEKQEPQFPSPEFSPAHAGAGRRLCRPVRGDGRLRLRGGEGQAEQCQAQEHQERRRHHRQNRRWRRNHAKVVADAVAPNAANAAKLGGVAPGGCQTGWLKASLVVDTDVIPPDAGSAVVPGFDCASNAQDAVQIKRTDVGRYLVTLLTMTPRMRSSRVPETTRSPP